jgi:hypothetical protein
MALQEAQMSAGMAPFDHHQASPGEIDAQAGTLERLAGKAIDLEAVTDAAFQPATANWDGICAPELRAAPEPVRTKARDTSGSLAWAAVPLRFWAAKVTAFNNEVDRIKGDFDAKAADHFGLRDHDGHPPQAYDYARACQAAWANATAAYWAALNTHIYDGATTTAGMFKNGPTEDNLAAARAVDAIPATPGAFSVFPAWWHQTNMEHAAADAMALAERIMSTDHDPSMDDLRQFNDLLSRYGSDPAFAYDFLNALGPRHLLELNGQLATLQLSYYDNGNEMYFDSDLARTVGAIQTGLGLALAAATHQAGQRGPGGSYTPGPYELSGQWMADLMSAGRDDFTLKHDDALGTRHYIAGVWGYQLLGPLLNHGDYDPQFLSMVGGDMVDFEMSQDQGSDIWRGNLGSNLRLDWSNGYGKDDPGGFDPVLPLLNALDRSPEAAKMFFTGSETFDHDAPDGTRLPRLDYLLTDRKWFLDTGSGWEDPRPLDQGDDQSHAYLQYLGLDRLGNVLDNATTTGRADSRSIAIVDSIVYEFNVDEQMRGAKNGGSDDHTVPFEDNDVVAPVLRDSMANIVKAYIFDVNRVMSASNAAMPGDVGLHLDQTQLTRFLAHVGKDETAHETIRQAEAAYAAAAYHFYLSGPGSEGDDITAKMNSVSNVADTYGSVLGAIDFGAAAEHHHTTAEADQQHNSDVEARYKVASFLVDQVVGRAKDAIPVPFVGDLASAFVDNMIDGAKEEAMHDSTGASDYEIGDLFGSGRRAAADLAMTSLYSSGALPDLPASLHTADGSPKPMSEWTPQDAQTWQQYVSVKGFDTAAFSGTTGRVGYDHGYDAARDTLRDAFH